MAFQKIIVADSVTNKIPITDIPVEELPGSGDMTKAVYDPDEDGLIAAPQLTGVPTLPLAQSDVTNLVTDLAGKTTLTAVKADADIADAITKKHSNSLDHSNTLDHNGSTQDSAIAGKEPANANIQAHVTAAHAPSNAQKNSDIIQAEIEAKLVGQIASHSHAGGGGEAFPVGSVFLAIVATDPATLLGYGTWSQIAQGKFLVGQDPTDTDFDIAEETGGAKIHTHADHAAYSHNQDTAAPKWWDIAGGDSKPDAHPAQGHDSPSHLPPYFVAYIWKRVS